jgi:hypothetical protein
MVNLGKEYLGNFRGNKIVEPSCGSGHFYRQIYREYVDEVLRHQEEQGLTKNAEAAHSEALDHIFGRDVDPFAVQLTLLGTFLEQLKDNVRSVNSTQRHTRQWAANKSIDTQNSLDPITINPDEYWDFDKTLDLSSARSRQASCRRALSPRLVIGNPPYGVSVVKGDHYDDIYTLGSPDSYGYFIVNAIRRLPEGGRVIFIVSSSFLTIKTHLQLRQFILANAKIIRVVKLSRHVFPGIDIFPVVIEMERCSDKNAREQHVYQFFDLWQPHPVNDEVELKKIYDSIQGDIHAAKLWPFPATRTARYTIRQGALATFSRVPIFEARPSLYGFMQDVFPATVPPEVDFPGVDGQIHKLQKVNVTRNRNVVKLSQIAKIKVGLQSGNNPKFYRAADGVQGGAATYQPVVPRNVVTNTKLKKLTAEEKLNGIRIDDPSSDRYYVPLDKSGAADIQAGLLAVFWRPVEFYINWSENAVAEI